MSQHPAPWTIDRKIASELDEGHRVLAELLDKLETEGWSSRDIFGLRLALEEAVVNAIKHGNGQDESKRVELVFTLTDRSIEVQVKDQGTGFKPDEIPDPLAPENLLKAYGRGIFFMRQFMDEVGYSFPSRGGTVVRMLKKLPS